MATKNEIVAGALRETHGNPREAYKRLQDQVGAEPMVFTFNPGSGLPRVPRVLGTIVDPDLKASDPTGARKSHRDRTQHEMCLRMCYAVANGNRPSRPSRPEPAPSPEPGNIPEPVTPEPETSPPASLPSEVARFLREVKRYRAEMKKRGDFDPMDSMRITSDGVRAIKAGVPVDGLLAAIGAPWPEDARVQIGVPKFDAAAWGRKQDDYDPRFHAAMPYVKRLLDAGLLVYLHGPAGTGKSSIAEGAAEHMGLDYREVNLAGAMGSAIKGKVTPDGIKTDTAFVVTYANGGVLALEEFDATHPNGAVAMNNALANGHFANDVDNKVYARHADFRAVATANTLANGSTKQFAGRSNLDGATKDRFRMGRVFIGLDEALEERIINDILAA